MVLKSCELLIYVSDGKDGQLFTTELSLESPEAAVPLVKNFAEAASAIGLKVTEASLNCEYDIISEPVRPQQ